MRPTEICVAHVDASRDIYFFSPNGQRGTLGEGVRCQTFYLVFSMFSTPRAGLATNLYKIVFFGLATNTLNVREIAYETVYYYYPVWRCTCYIISVLLLLFVSCPCTAINISVQYNDGLLPDILLLTHCYYHRGTRLNAMRRFFFFAAYDRTRALCDNFSPVWGMFKRFRYVQAFL